MKWDREKIFTEVTDSADRYGDNNSQQWNQLIFALSNAEGQEVWEGLLQIFLTNSEIHFSRQNLAGNLLYKVNPVAEIDLSNCIKQSIKTLNLSIGQSPWYLANRFGKEKIIEECNKLANTTLADSESECLKTFKWWAERHIG